MEIPYIAFDLPYEVVAMLGSAKTLGTHIPS